MKVLVIIPTHNRVQFLDEAIASVKAQTRPADELVITGNVGPGLISDKALIERLNEAIEQSDCDAFVMLGDDDKLEPTFIERTMREMETRGVDIVYTDCFVFGERNNPAFALGGWTKENIDNNTVPLVTSLCSRRAWERAGKYQPSPFFDWHFWWRCFYSGATAYYLQEHLWHYRVHKDQGSQRENLRANREYMLRFIADEKRKRGIN